MNLKVFELFSGIGGMHLALKESGVEADVLCAVDINLIANAVYKHNFPDTNLMNNNIQCFTEKDFNDLNIDFIMMSPPCQPYTRTGLKKDKEDARNRCLLHIIQLIPKLTTVKYILLENVQGFETSDTRTELIKTLKESNFAVQEFLINPSQYGVPNSRLRYYLLARREKFNFETSGDISRTLPVLVLGGLRKPFTIRDILNEETYLVPDKIVQKRNFKKI